MPFLSPIFPAKALPTRSGSRRVASTILTQLTGLTFAETWPDRLRRPFGDVEADFIGRTAFLRNKRATGRPKDLGDIEGME